VEHDHPLDGTQLVVLAGLGWSRRTCIPKGFKYYRDHFISTILSVIKGYLALSYVLPYRGVTRLDGGRGKKQVWHPHVRT